MPAVVGWVCPTGPSSLDVVQSSTTSFPWSAPVRGPSVRGRSRLSSIPTYPLYPFCRKCQPRQPALWSIGCLPKARVHLWRHHDSSIHHGCPKGAFPCLFCAALVGTVQHHRYMPKDPGDGHRSTCCGEKGDGWGGTGGALWPSRPPIGQQRPTDAAPVRKESNALSSGGRAQMPGFVASDAYTDNHTALVGQLGHKHPKMTKGAIFRGCVMT